MRASVLYIIHLFIHNNSDFYLTTFMKAFHFMHSVSDERGHVDEAQADLLQHRRSSTY